MGLLPFKSVRFKLILLSVMHFVTDGLCSFLIFSKLYSEGQDKAIIIFFLYNILAFVTQSPIGSLIDKYNRPKVFLAFSMLTMILGYLFSGIWILSTCFIGISNSLFHVAGGKYVTDKSGNDISYLGIFVSTGAVGLVLGQRYLSIISLPYIFFILFIVCGLLVIFCEDSKDKGYCQIFDKPELLNFALVAVVAVVAVRSFVGKVVTPDFTPAGHIFLFISIATALGKALGGICSKVFGIKATTYASMAIAALCLTLGAGNEYMFILGVFAFNFSMPITLYFANVLLKGSEGFAFGTLAAALVPGNFIAMSFTYSPIMRVCTAILCVATMIIIVWVSKRVTNYDNSSNINDNN